MPKQRKFFIFPNFQTHFRFSNESSLKTIVGEYKHKLKPKAQAAFLFQKHSKTNINYTSAVKLLVCSTSFDI